MNMHVHPQGVQNKEGHEGCGRVQSAVILGRARGRQLHEGTVSISGVNKNTEQLLRMKTIMTLFLRLADHPSVKCAFFVAKWSWTLA